MEEDPRAKAHLSLTADAMEEVLALGGIVDQDDQGPVHLDGFAEQVWRVDTPSTSQAPSSLLSAFQRDTTGPVDFDALLQFPCPDGAAHEPYTPHSSVGPRCRSARYPNAGGRGRADGCTAVAARLVPISCSAD